MLCASLHKAVFWIYIFLTYQKKKVNDYMFLLGFCAQAKIRGLYAVPLLDGIKNAINEEGRSCSNK